MTSALHTMNVSSYSNLSFDKGNKIYVPVRSDQVIYSHFDHVSGFVQGGKDDSGVPISKIRMLNTLIEQLVRMQNNKIQPKLPSDLSDEQVDAMIEQYQSALEVAINSSKSNPFAFDGLGTISTGIISSVSV